MHLELRIPGVLRSTTCSASWATMTFLTISPLVGCRFCSLDILPNLISRSQRVHPEYSVQGAEMQQFQSLLVWKQVIRTTGMGRDFWTPCTRAILNQGPFGNEASHPRLCQGPYPKPLLGNISLMGSSSCLETFGSILQSYWSHKGPFTQNHFRDAFCPRWIPWTWRF